MHPAGSSSISAAAARQRQAQAQPPRVHDPPHPSQRDAPSLTLEGVSVPPPRNNNAHGRHRPAALIDSSDDENPWSGPTPHAAAAASRHVEASPARSRTSDHDRQHHNRIARSRSPPRTYGQQLAAQVAAASSRPSSAAPSPMSTPARRSATDTAPPPAPSEPRSEAERFERWKQGLHEYLQTSSPNTQNRQQTRHFRSSTVAPADSAPEAKQDAMQPPPRRRPMHADPTAPLPYTDAAGAPSSVVPSVKSTPAASPHATPTRHQRPASAATLRSAAPANLSRSLATLHKKVRAGAAVVANGSQRLAQTPLLPQAHDAPNSRTFDRLSAGLSAHPTGQQNGAAASATAAPAPFDPRHSLEDVEAAFIARLQAWMPTPAVVVPTEMEGPPPARSARPGAGNTIAAAHVPPGSKLRRGASAQQLHPSSAVLSEEDAIRARARALAADMAALAHRKRVAFLAEQAAQLRIQQRLQLEEQELAIRTQLEKKIMHFREQKDASVHGCLQLQQDVRSEISLLQALDQQLSSRVDEVEHAHAEALSELQGEYARTMDALHEQSAAQLDRTLQQLSDRTQAQAQQQQPAPSYFPPADADVDTGNVRSRSTSPPSHEHFEASPTAAAHADLEPQHSDD